MKLLPQAVLHILYKLRFAGLTVLLAASTACSFDYAKHAKAQRCSSLFSYERQLKPDPEIEKEFYKVNKRFGGPGIYFVDYFKDMGKKHCGRPAIDYMLFLKGYLRGKPKTDFGSMVDSVGTAIHETAHHYSSLAYQFDQSIDKRRTRYHLGRTSYYTKEMGLRHLFHTRTFPGKEIAKVIKDKNVFKNSRYAAYIGKASKYHVTQQFGIYGLLDEFHAYYYSLISKNNILKQLDNKQRRIYLKDNTFTELGNNDIDLSFLEFKLFILSYFRVAEEYYPDIYKQLMNYPDLLDVTLIIHDKFEQQYMESQRIYKKDKLHDSFTKERKTLTTELALPEYGQMLNKLRKTRIKLSHKLKTPMPG
ncbi:MAG: hypothetical protein OEY00_11070 [Gammaproteobacteria bacterium]|nr:hypothetical protein [Gammaproteobacteria bacterium]